MRYHWGLGVGHIHAHRSMLAMFGYMRGHRQGAQSSEQEPEDMSGANASSTPDGNDSDIYDSDDPELGLEDRHLDGWENVELEDSDSEDGEGDEEMVEEHFTGI